MFRKRIVGLAHNNLLKGATQTFPVDRSRVVCPSTDGETMMETNRQRTPWNKGKIVGQKPALKLQ